MWFWHRTDRWTFLLFLHWPLPTLHFLPSLPLPGFPHASVDLCPLASCGFSQEEVLAGYQRVRVERSGCFPPDPSLLFRQWLCSLHTTGCSLLHSSHRTLITLSMLPSPSGLGVQWLSTTACLWMLYHPLQVP